MILISHRGNTFGENPDLENTPAYIDAAIEASFLCEVDVWKIGDNLFLSHDYPKNKEPVDIYFFMQRKKDLIIHCKNMEALCFFAANKEPIHPLSNIKYHYFWHQNDAYTLTSKGWIWAYPGETVTGGVDAICVLPEKSKRLVVNFTGICSDYVGKWLD